MVSKVGHSALIPILLTSSCEVERKVKGDDPSQIFKRQYISLLSDIRNSLQKAIEKDSKTELERKDLAESVIWWTTQSPTQRSTVEAQCRAVQEILISKKDVSVMCAGDENAVFHSAAKVLSEHNTLTILKADSAPSKSVDIILAPHTLYKNMKAIFKASEDLLRQVDPLPIDKHPLFPYFQMLNKDGIFVITLTSGPNVPSFTDLMLGKHGLSTETANLTGDLNLKIFNNVETFFRCLDIFKRRFETVYGKTIDCKLSYSMPHLPLEPFCESLIRQFPEIGSLDLSEREKFIRLLSAFMVGRDIVDLNITLKLSVKDVDGPRRSFKPLCQEHLALQNGTNEISLGQLDLAHQIQNLNGSEIAMPYLKDADGPVQFKAFASLLGRKMINLVDIGGGRGETNAVPHALHETGMDISLLNIEPHEPFARPYIQSYKDLGMHKVAVKQLYAQDLSSKDVVCHFKGEHVDGVFASHCFYFILGDMLKASFNPELPLDQHPLWKYIHMMKPDGVLVATMQSGAGTRLWRNAILGNHGLYAPSFDDQDVTVSLLSSFGNLATFLRYFEGFAERYKKETGKTLHVKMSHSVANVPLGGFKVVQDPLSKGYVMHNPHGEDADPSWLAPRMLDFYGNWKELQITATSAAEKGKRATAIKTQETFLHILRAFAPGEVCMQHPNITLEITHC
jgi:hypothetical protein